MAASFSINFTLSDQLHKFDSMGFIGLYTLLSMEPFLVFQIPLRNKIWFFRNMNKLYLEALARFMLQALNFLFLSISKIINFWDSFSLTHLRNLRSWIWPMPKLINFFGSETCGSSSSSNLSVLNRLHSDTGVEESQIGIN